MSFVLLKNGKPVARIVPEKQVCLGKDLAEALAKTSLSDEEARAWHKDLVEARRSLQAPADKEQ
jgi:antitoxin (DNA-binding transcriptional repressor) of toxin-antitoxin stability system